MRLVKTLMNTQSRASVITNAGCRSQTETCNKPCIICPFMKKSTNVTSHVTNKHYRLKGYYKCQTKSAVYLISCSKCSLQYVGQTGNTINERIHRHLTDIRVGNDFKPVSRHFMSNNHTVNNITVITTTSQTTNIWLRTEEVWIALLKTREPGGLSLIQ